MHSYSVFIFCSDHNTLKHNLSDFLIFPFFTWSTLVKTGFNLQLLFMAGATFVISQLEVTVNHVGPTGFLLVRGEEGRLRVNARSPVLVISWTTILRLYTSSSVWFVLFFERVSHLGIGSSVKVTYVASLGCSPLSQPALYDHWNREHKAFPIDGQIGKLDVFLWLSWSA